LEIKVFVLYLFFFDRTVSLFAEKQINKERGCAAHDLRPMRMLMWKENETMLEIVHNQNDFDLSALFRGRRDGTERPRPLHTRYLRYREGGCDVIYPVKTGKITFAYGKQDESGLLALTAVATEDAPLDAFFRGFQDAVLAHRFGSNQFIVSSPNFPQVTMILKVGADNYVTDSWPDVGVTEESTVGEFLGLLHEFCAQFSCDQWRKSNMLGLTLVPPQLRQELGCLRVSCSCTATGTANIH
jgi:hypothetical protein